MPKGKRLVKLRRSEQFRYLGNQMPNQRDEEPVKWASCAVQDSIKFPLNLPTPGPSGIYIGRSFEIATTIFAVFAFLPLAVPVITGYAVLPVAQGGVYPIAASAAGTGGVAAGGFLTGLLAGLGFTNPSLHGPEMTSFSKPCDPNAGKY